MPADLLTQEDRAIERFCVVGQFSSDPPRFVRHVALYSSQRRVIKQGQLVAVAHMGPPLRADGQIPVQIVGSIPLTVEEISEIETWIEKIRDEYELAHARRFDQYVIHPVSEDFRDPNTGVRRYRRFSCAGFVIDAHREVEIDLLDTDDDNLPEVSQKELVAAYPEVDRMDVTRRERLGLKGDGPWRVVLAGYVCHSLNRPSEVIRSVPYKPRVTDKRF